LHRVKGMRIFQIFLVCDGHDDRFPQQLEFHPDMEPVKLRFHRPGRTALNEIAKTVITVCDDTHDGISFHALLQKEAVEETVGPTWIRRNEDKTRTKLSITFDSARRYLELACNRGPSMLHIRVVDANYQRLNGLGHLHGLAVHCVKSLGLKYSA
jgi:hypothetical protein